ncbi:MAG: DUF4268 domain-containing protein [Alteromonadaceae bacterium]|nr:DUF4268 domain-containing protein [Alteromonadaceae bacterium]
MFKVDLAANRIQRLDSTSFSSQNLRERDNLQEWLAHQPDALGEELLIIQKEFDGFADTRERLDLLALDTDGQLVVIENKLDDSGRDVAWQAIKYAAYVSSLTKSQIIDIYQTYLDRYCGGGNASENISEFLKVDTLDGVVLNEGHDQRLMFIAANFRKEVTSTVLWLREHKIDARCLRVTPYRHENDLFVDIQQVIPTPEAAEFMISMAKKEIEEKETKGQMRLSHQMRLAFWEQLLEDFRRRGLEKWQNISAGKDNWLLARTGVAQIAIGLLFTKDEVRVELQINKHDPNENFWLFDRLYAERDRIEGALQLSLDWRRMDDKRVCLIVSRFAVQGFVEENWPMMNDWLAETYCKFEATFTDRVHRLAAELKSAPLEAE